METLPEQSTDRRKRNGICRLLPASLGLFGSGMSQIGGTGHAAGVPTKDEALPHRSVLRLQGHQVHRPTERPHGARLPRMCALVQQVPKTNPKTATSHVPAENTALPRSEKIVSAEKTALWGREKAASRRTRQSCGTVPAESLPMREREKATSRRTRHFNGTVPAESQPVWRGKTASRTRGLDGSVTTAKASHGIHHYVWGSRTAIIVIAFWHSDSRYICRALRRSAWRIKICVAKNKRCNEIRTIGQNRLFYYPPILIWITTVIAEALE